VLQVEQGEKGPLNAPGSNKFVVDEEVSLYDFAVRLSVLMSIVLFRVS